MRHSAAQIALILLCAVAASLPVCPQNQPTSETTLQISSNLVVVNAVALKGGTSAPDDTLDRDDFQVFDNNRPVTIKTFDKGSGTRPLAVWFLVQCSMKDWKNEGSGIFAGQIGLFEPALSLLTPQDAVGVAHWCDNGASSADLAPATKPEQALATLEQVLAPVVEPPSHTRPGELALQSALQRIVDATHASASNRVPVVIFLYDDYSAMPRSEADRFVDELLKTAATVYGIKNRQSPRIYESRWFGGEQGAIANYIATQTGGRYIAADAPAYADALRGILNEVHLRYELGFTPQALDGKRHHLRVTLTGAAKQQHPGTTIRYRSGYIAALAQ